MYQENAMVQDKDGPTIIRFGRLAIHFAVAIAVAMSVETMVKRYVHLDHWMIVKDSRGRSFVWIVALSVGLMARRMLDFMLPLKIER